MIHRPIVCRRFIGREDELAYLQERRREAGASHGGLILLGGEAGVGKTRLLSEFTATLAKTRWRVAQSPCLEFAQRPYGPVLGILARLDPNATELAPAASKHEQLEAIVAALTLAAARNALVVIVEDLHWADVATMELLAHLSARLDTMRMLVVASFRPEQFQVEHPAFAGIAKLARAPHAGRIDLAPLDDGEQQRFIGEALSGLELSAATLRDVARVSDGNPFFIEELLKNAVERQAGEPRAHASRTLPATVNATVMERLRPLSEAERHVVAQAAVIGRSFDLALLAQTLGAQAAALLPALRRARDLQLIEERAPTVFRFRHALTREAIYAGFLAEEVRPLHRTIGLALEDAPAEQRSIESLAYHWWCARDGERATRYNESAGDAAADVYAHDDAIVYFERAADAEGIDAGVRARIVAKVADRRVALGQYDDAAAAYSAAADLYRASGDTDGEATCRVRVAVQNYTLGRKAPTADLEAMLERLGENDYLARSRVHLGVAWLAASFDTPSVATHHLALIDEHAFEREPDVRVRYYNVRAWVSMLIGDAERFRVDHGAWIEAARRAGGVGMVAAAHYNGAYCFALFGMHAEAECNIRTALAIAEAERSRHVAASAYGMSAFCAVLRGDLVGAREALRHLSTLPSDNEVVRAHAMAWGTLAGTYLDDRALIEEWFDRPGDTIAPFFAAMCGAGYAEVMMRRGRYVEARALLHDGIGSGERQRGNVLTLLAVARYGADDDLSRARAVLETAADAPSDVVERHAIGLFDALVARREGRRDDATRAAATAVDGFARLGFPLLEALAREITGDRTAALALYRRCGAAHDVRRLDDTIPEPAEPASAGPAAGDLTGLAGLSPRERQIAELAAQGRSNQDIARELAISHKTVEKHLGAIYLRFGFASRTQLAAHVSQRREREHS